MRNATGAALVIDAWSFVGHWSLAIFSTSFVIQLSSFIRISGF
jgi:lipid-A-disaccharide synthase-like uncharacterized protein